MRTSKADIISQLQQDIFPLQGLRHCPPANVVDIGLGPLNASFPNGCFPTAAIHEFISKGLPAAAATNGFIAGVLGALMQSSGAAVWISSGRTLFPPALKSFNVEPDRIIFIDGKNDKHIPWAVEEALKCNGLAAVIGELQEISFTTSRRLQLAVEQSSVTGFIHRNNPRNLTTTACVSRWEITPMPSELEPGMPGVGFPRWNVKLLKIRNGRPGAWDLEWLGNGFHVPVFTGLQHELIKKTG